MVTTLMKADKYYDDLPKTRKHKPKWGEKFEFTYISSIMGTFMCVGESRATTHSYILLSE